MFEECFFARIVHVDLAALENLERDTPVGIVSEEGATAGFADIAHHAADAHRAVESTIEIVEEFESFEGFSGVAVAVKIFFDELQHLVQALFAHIARFEFFEIGESTGLQADEQTGKHLFVSDGVGFQPVGADIVDGFDEDHIGIEVVEVFDQGAVSAGAEEQAAVCVAKRRAVGVGSHSVGGWFLLGEGDVELYAFVLHKTRSTLFGQCFEKGAVFGRNGEVESHVAVGAGIFHPFHEVLFERRARSVGIAMELQQSLGQTAVIESFGQQQTGHYFLVFAFGHERSAVFTVQFHERSIECAEERGVGQVFEEGLGEGVCRCVGCAVEEGKEVLEHAACCAGSGDELDHCMVAFVEVALPCSEIEVAFRLGGDVNATVVHRCGGFQFEERETVLEVG